MTIFAWQFDFARPVWLAVLAALPLWIVYWRRSLVVVSPSPHALVDFLPSIHTRDYRGGARWANSHGSHDGEACLRAFARWYPLRARANRNNRP